MVTKTPNLAPILRRAPLIVRIKRDLAAGLKFRAEKGTTPIKFALRV